MWRSAISSASRRIVTRRGAFAAIALAGAGAAGCMASISHAEGASSTAEAAYVEALKRVAPSHDDVAPPPPSSSSSPSPAASQPSAVVDVSAINAKAREIRAKRIARGNTDPADDDDDDDEEAEATGSTSTSSTSSTSPISYTYKPARGGASSSATTANTVVEVRSKNDVASIDKEVAVIAIVRGAHPSLAEAVEDSVKAAAALDQRGFTFYAVTDATPDNVCEFLERALHAEIPDPYVAPSSDASATSTTSSGTNAEGDESESGLEMESAVPIVSVFDRAGATRRKYFMPSAVDRVEELEEATPAAVAAPSPSSSSPSSSSSSSSLPAPPLSPTESVLLSALPYPSDIMRFLESFVSGQLEPTLLGAPRPLNDAHPLLPYLTQVVSSSWKEIVLDPSKDVCLEAYLTHCPMCMCLSPRVRMLAYLANKFFPSSSVRVAVMNVDENDRPHDWMPGPAFPTIQLFNTGTGPYSKLLGPSCQPLRGNGGASVHLASPETFESGLPGVPPHSHSPDHRHTHAHAQPLKEAPSPSARLEGIARTATKGSPSCIPSVDFTHPTVPGKMALPSVHELLGWVAAHSSKPFDPSAVRVPKEEVLGSLIRYADMLPAPPRAAADASPLVQGHSGDGGSGEDQYAPNGTVSLTDLAHDMDAEARVLEYAVFDLMFYEHVSELAGKATGAVSAPGVSGTDIGAGPLPTYSSEAWKAKYSEFKKAVGRLRYAAVDKAAYGAAEEALDAMDAVAHLSDSTGIKGVARSYSHDREEMTAVASALPLAARLARDEAEAGLKKRMQ